MTNEAAVLKEETTRKAENYETRKDKNTQASKPNIATNGASTESDAKDKEGPCGLPSKCTIL